MYCTLYIYHWKLFLYILNCRKLYTPPNTSIMAGAKLLYI